MSFPTPNNMPNRPAQKEPEQVKNNDQPVKRPFVRKPHLTDRPFRDHPGLRELKTNINK